MRTILVTGASSGIGRDAACTLRQRGWRVLATCRQAEDAARLAAAGVEPLTLELASEESVAAVADETLARTGGRLDALFNNAAFATPGAVEDLPRAALREIFEVNLFGQVDLTNRLLPAMRRAGAGRVVMNSSVLGLVAAPWRGAYVATKFALEGLTDVLRLELAGTGVHVVLIEPGPIDTPFRRNSILHFERHVDWRASPHRAAYEARLLPRLHAETPGAGQHPPSAVTARLIEALESRRPRARYGVTGTTRGAAIMRRIFPTALSDRILRLR
ncbi:MAG: SDR family NAD(P)-dependent oxidoreductase [Amaricoccus sp.]|uniref:SDR family NAD(P)-dependent oxidoreductase n=1 Tax=Amaricoccus sp. TaxID=1872485 RepID=UPI0039E25579